MSNVDIGLADNNKVVSAQAHDVLLLKLPEIPTSGVRWDFETLEKPLKLEADNYEHLNVDGIGGAAVHVFKLLAQSPGRAQVRLRKWQSWEGESTIEETFSCTIQVKP